MPLAAILSQAVRLNVLLAVFNMPRFRRSMEAMLGGLLPLRLARQFNLIRPYGFLLLYALILSGGFESIVVPPYRFILAWLPTK